MKVKDCFNKNGDFINPLFDPYRTSSEDMKIYETLFNSHGYAIRTDEVIDLIVHNNWNWDCDAVKYVYSADFDYACKSNDSAIYAWRLLLIYLELQKISIKMNELKFKTVKDILCNLIISGMITPETKIEDAVRTAIDVAEELIKQFREEC